MDDELKAKKDSDKKRNTFIVIAVLAPGLFICLIIVVAIIIALNSMISPLQKATGVIGLSVENIFQRESAEELFEKMKDFPSVKGNYKNNNAMDDIEYLFFEEIYKVSKYTPCSNKDNAIVLVMATLFYDGEINEAMNPNNQSYTKIKYNYSGDGYNEVVLDDNSDLISQYENIEFSESEATKEIKKLYSKACQGYSAYQQYLLNIYIPKYYPYLKDIKDEKIRNKEIEKIGEGMIFTADNYIRLSTGSHMIDYDTYEKKVPNPKFESSEAGTIIIIDEDYKPVHKTGSHNGIGWKQGSGTAWAGIMLANVTGGAMKDIGCYVTSISIAMAYSGTHINSEYFDPGVLAIHLKQNGSFDSTGSLMSNDWGELAPNFNLVGRYYTSGLNNSQIEASIRERIDAGYSVVLHVNNGTHFVAVVGYDSNGNIKISDPARGYDNMIINNYFGGIVDYRVFTN